MSQFLTDLFLAVEAQKEIVKGHAVYPDGSVCAIGAYGAFKCPTVAKAVKLLRTNCQSLTEKIRSDAAAAASERSVELAFANSDSRTMQAVYDYNDGRDEFEDETIPTTESPVARRTRLLNALGRGILPGLL